MAAEVQSVQLIYQRSCTIAALPADERLTAAKLLIEQSVVDADWLEDKHFQVDPVQGWSLHPIYLSAESPFGVFITAWLPKRGAPPHTHGSWTVIGGLVGLEKNTLWRRLDDGSQLGYAEIDVVDSPVIGPGDVLVMPCADDIHSVCNECNEVSVTLHAYGVQPNIAQREVFDPVAKTVQPFVTNIIKYCTDLP